MRITENTGTFAMAGGETSLAARAESIRARITEYVATYNAGIVPGSNAAQPAPGSTSDELDLARLGVTRTSGGKLAFDEDVFARNIASGATRPGELVTTLQAIESLDAASGDLRPAVTGIGGRYSGVA